MLGKNSKSDCYETDSNLILLQEAKDRVLRNVLPIRDSEAVTPEDATERVLFDDIASPIDVPPHRNAAMDGYAVDSRQVPSSHAMVFAVAGTSKAGRPHRGSLQPGQVVRIMTGAIIPGGADLVVPQEHVEVIGKHEVRIGPGHRAGANVRPAGEDIRRGQTVLNAGTRIGPAEAGVLASLGVTTVTVRRRIRVAVLSTGDELRNRGQDLDSGALFDSNRYTIMAMLRRIDAEISDCGIQRDNPSDLLQVLHDAASNHDVVISSGGVSTGSADHVLEVVRKVGSVQVWRVAVRPGRPFAQGRIGDALFFGLPGNPVAVMVTYYQLVQPALRRLMGENNIEPEATVQARSVSRFRKKPGRTEVYRAILSRDSQGQSIVRSTGDQGSGLLHSMSVANCFVILVDDDDSAAPGDYVRVQPFYGLM
ncbi:MAG: molybdopterin-binding protein [Gammaproteobacteria bacterium]|nr:molybdopterin-binding protein [Gammaproteobacteria bacterium]MDH3467496.1 molybdopterin-binding protein [Gammaproteobacteria bacterium]